MKHRNNFYNEEQKEIIKFGKILLCLIVIIGILYLFTNYVVNKEDTYKRTNNDGSINYDVVLLGSILNKKDEEYYILAFDQKDMINATLLNKYNEYKSLPKHLPIYIADLSNELNKTYIAEKSQYKADTVEEMKLEGNTLIKVKNAKIVKFIENKDDILAELN